MHRSTIQLRSSEEAPEKLLSFLDEEYTLDGGVRSPGSEPELDSNAPRKRRRLSKNDVAHEPDSSNHITLARIDISMVNLYLLQPVLG